eukprot:4827101-Prorocentrum_lima.AAC.1
MTLAHGSATRMWPGVDANGTGAAGEPSKSAGTHECANEHNSTSVPTPSNKPPDRKHLPASAQGIGFRMWLPWQGAGTEQRISQAVHIACSCGRPAAA